MKIIITENQLHKIVEDINLYNICNKLISQGYIIHGTNNNFEKFDKSKIIGGMRAREGYGFYFTDMAYKACEYGTIIKYVKKDKFNFISLTEPINQNSQLYKSLFGDEELLKQKKELEDLANYYYEQEMYNKCLSVYDEIDKLPKYSEGVIYKNDRQVFLDAIEQYKSPSLGNLQVNLINPQKNLPKLAYYLIKLGYDGGYYDGIYTIWNFDKLNQEIKTL